MKVGTSAPLAAALRTILVSLWYNYTTDYTSAVNKSVPDTAEFITAAVNVVWSRAKKKKGKRFVIYEPNEWKMTNHAQHQINTLSALNASLTANVQTYFIFFKCQSRKNRLGRLPWQPSESVVSSRTWHNIWFIHLLLVSLFWFLSYLNSGPTGGTWDKVEPIKAFGRGQSREKSKLRYRSATGLMDDLVRAHGSRI